MNDDAITLPETPIVIDFYEIFYDDKPTGRITATYSEGLDEGVLALKENKSWMVVEVRHGDGTVRGKVWKNPLEGRIIRPKQMG